MNSNDLKEFVENNPKLVTRKESDNYPGLFVIKYTRSVFYDNLWNDILKETRGLVVDADYNIVIHPFTKIMNRGENGTDMNLADRVDVVRKVNGFMAAVTLVNGEPIVSTTGSLDSDFVRMAKEKIGKPDVPWKEGFTFIFEIVHEDDPHVIPEKPCAYLIGMRDLTGVVMRGPMLDEWKLDAWARKMGFKRPSWMQSTFGDVLHMMKACKHEGFVVRRIWDDYTLKIKSKYYLQTKLFGRMGEAKLEHLLNHPDWIGGNMDEEYFPLINYLAEMKDDFMKMDELHKMEIIREFLDRD